MIESIQAMVFDADGMVIAGERFSTRFARAYGVPMEDISAFFDNEFRDCLVGKRDLKEALAPYFPKWHWTGTMEELLRFWFAESYRVEPAMIEAIAVLRDRGLKCILATNQEKYRVAFMKKEMGLARVFDEIFSSAQIGVKKSNPVFLSIVADRFPNIPHGAFLFWDDRQENIVAAKQFGFQAMLYTTIDDFKKTCGLP